MTFIHQNPLDAKTVLVDVKWGPSDWNSQLFRIILKSRGIFGESSLLLLWPGCWAVYFSNVSLTFVVQNFFRFSSTCFPMGNTSLADGLTFDQRWSTGSSWNGWNQLCMHQALTSAHSLCHYQKVITQYN